MEEKELLQDKQLQDKELDPKEEPQPDQKPEPKPEEKKFSQEEVDSILKNRLERELKKFKQELSEAEKLAKMSEEERAKLEMDKMKAEFEAEKAQFQKEKLEIAATKILSKEGLPVDFAPLLLGEDAEATKTNIDAFKGAFQDAVEKAVEDKLRGGYKPKKADGQASAVSVEEFKKMGAAERTALFNSNPELYKQLKQQAH